MVPLPFLPVVDGIFLPEHPLTAVAKGGSTGVDLLIGTNRDELTLFGLGNPALMALDEDGARGWVANAVPDMSATEVVDAYRAARRARGEPVGATDIWVAVGTDVVFRWPDIPGSRGFNHLPYRMLLPKGVDNLLVAGRCASMTHGGQSAARVTGACFVMGEAAGTAAAMVVAGNTTPRGLHVAELQRRLRENKVFLGI